MSAAAVPDGESRGAASREHLEVAAADRARPRPAAMVAMGPVRGLGVDAGVVGGEGQGQVRVRVSGAMSAHVGHGERKR